MRNCLVLLGILCLSVPSFCNFIQVPIEPKNEITGLNVAEDGLIKELKLNFKNSILPLDTLLEKEYSNILCLMDNENITIQDDVLDSVNSLFTHFEWGIEFYINVENEQAMIEFKEESSKFNTTLKKLENLLKINECTIPQKIDEDARNLRNFENIVRFVLNKTPALDDSVKVEEIFIDYLQTYNKICEMNGDPITNLVSFRLSWAKMIVNRLTRIHDHLTNYEVCLRNPNEFLKNWAGETGPDGVWSLELYKQMSSECLKKSYEKTIKEN